MGRDHAETSDAWRYDAVDAGAGNPMRGSQQLRGQQMNSQMNALAPEAPKGAATFEMLGRLDDITMHVAATLEIVETLETRLFGISCTAGTATNEVSKPSIPNGFVEHHRALSAIIYDKLLLLQNKLKSLEDRL